MIRTVASRLLQAIPLFLAISVLVFASAHLAPGDPISNALTGQVSQASIDAIRHAYGLDRPLAGQYFVWLGHFLSGQWGDSIVLRVPVASILGPAFRNTLLLAGAAVVICVVFGVAIGVAAGLNRGSRVDLFSMFAIQLGHNVPIFWLGLALVWLFSLKLHWLPSSGIADLRGDGGPLDLARHLVLPAFSAAVISMLILARLVRASVIEIARSDYVRTCESLGFPRANILWRHLGRNLLSPVVNMTGLQIGYLLSGVILVENVFAWPGLGAQLYVAAAGRDYPLEQAGVMLVAACFVVANLVTDVALDLLNPRLRT
ncbi:ABC transporter permease [Burkholderia sp. WAC0059]|uniref:ABC transporter permease n=1 Tax=Burkholderia sp. WAC0059 TaxID=2066022 RepID=UPI000C7F1636|nr:ABC transporter permease [Burkholderia sp. WAC0059]PLZ01799.1 ABC transporter permease [Burkholderia sp. WAC0059]